MNKYQFAAIFFSIALLREGVNPIIQTGFGVCATIAFLVGLNKE